MAKINLSEEHLKFLNPMTRKNVADSKKVQDNIIAFLNQMAKRNAAKFKCSQDDLFQVGFLALDFAAKNFNPSKGLFMNYSFTVVNNAMLNAAKHINQVYSEDAEDDTDMSEMLEKKNDPKTEKETKWICPFTPIDNDEDSPHMEICDCDNLTPSESFELADMRAAVKYLVNRLPDKERIAVSKMYGFDGLYERTLENVAEELGFSKEAARKSCNRGVERLRGWLSEPRYGFCA